MSRAVPILLALLALAFALLTPGAWASTTINIESPSYPYGRWINKAKAPTPDIPIEVREEACDAEGHFNACIDVGPDGATMHLPPQRGIKAIFFHEVGHAYLLNHVDADEYSVLSARLGTRDVEIAADAYSVCARRGLRPRFADGIASARWIGQRPLRRACRVIRASY